jgi:hypothetical protein
MRNDARSGQVGGNLKILEFVLDDRKISTEKKRVAARWPEKNQYIL